MTTQSQCSKILAYLKEGNGITPIEALNLFGCFRLSARIADIKKMGYEIVSELVNVGDGKRAACYHLVSCE